MWYKIANEHELSTPALLVFPERIKENIKRMIAIAGSTDRLRPHVKTHKMAEVVQVQVEQGITKFKCATLSELEMAAQNGGKDILLAYPLLGPDIQKFIELQLQYPEVKFAVTVDAFDACADLTRAAISNNCAISVFIDIDNGMHRTGANVDEAFDLATKLEQSEFLNLKGLHIYDGHIHTVDPIKRKQKVEDDFRQVDALLEKLNSKGINYGELACGGTFSFPFHAEHSNRTLCPGTPLLWDAGYEKHIPDLDFLHAAVVIGRVISKPKGHICFDLGHKAIAAEMPQPRLEFLDVSVKSIENQSEEHLVIKSNDFKSLELGELTYALPHHICPTVALHEKVYVAENNFVSKTWDVVARKRTY